MTIINNDNQDVAVVPLFFIVVFLDPGSIPVNPFIDDPKTPSVANSSKSTMRRGMYVIKLEICPSARVFAGF